MPPSPPDLHPGPTPRRIHIAVLECDTLMPRARAAYGGYTGLYENLLRKGLKSLKAEDLRAKGDAVDRVRGVGIVGGEEDGDDVGGGTENGCGDGEVELRFSKYDAVEGSLPTEEELEGVDAVLVSGAKHSAFDSPPWITALVAFIQTLLTQNRIRIIGVCFGHQIIGRAMGQTVARNDKGWEVTVTPLELTERGRKVFGCESLALHQMHHDILLAHPPHSIPLLATPVCAVQDIYLPGRVLAVQAHPEFTPEVMAEILTTRHQMGVFDAGMFHEAMGRRMGRTGEGSVAGAMVRFLVGGL